MAFLNGAGELLDGPEFRHGKNALVLDLVGYEGSHVSACHVAHIIAEEARRGEELVEGSLSANLPSASWRSQPYVVKNGADRPRSGFAGGPDTQ